MILAAVLPHASHAAGLVVAGRAELDNFDKMLVAAHVGSMGFYVVGGFWIKASLARAQRAIPPAQSAVIGRLVGFDYTIVSWLAFLGVGLTGYILLGRDGLADPPEAMDKLQRDMGIAVRGIDALAWLNLALAVGAFVAGYALSFDHYKPPTSRAAKK